MSLGASDDGAGHDKVLKMFAGSYDGADSVVFALLVEGDELGRFGIPLAELGIGGSREPYGKSGPRRDLAREASLPATRADELRALAARVLDEADVLWLELEPGGGLEQLPWERWLAPLVSVPILRRPRSAIKPVLTDDVLDVVVCASMPESKAPFPLPDLIESSVLRTREAGLDARFHVFVDHRFEYEVRERFGARDVSAVVVHPTESARAYGQAPRVRGLDDRAEALDNPWLEWMLASLPPSGIDVVHFLCHGFLADGRGSLAFAESPLFNEDTSWARFVGGSQLSTFLDRVGAVGLVLGSPPENFSVSGLYALADQIARERPGPVLVHDLETGSADDVGQALVFLFGEEAPKPPAGVTIYCHPGHLRRPTSRERGSTSRDVGYESFDVGPEADEGDRLLRSFSLAEPGRTWKESSSGAGWRGDSPKGTPETPRWLSASQRSLERYAAELAGMGSSDSKRGRAMRKGKAEALKFVSDLLKSNLGEDS